jgi:hypothetical protein
MCGPLNFAFLGEYISKDTSVLIKRFSLYHSGRLFSYMMIGIFAGFLGQAISMVILQKSLSIISGFAFAIFGILLLLPYFKSKIYSPPAFINKLTGKLLNNKKWSKNSFLHGALNGIIPCGLVYMALAGALATYSFQNAVLYMFLFGLGTIPALFSLLVFGKKLTSMIHFNYKIIIPLFFILSGVFTLIKAFNVEIPSELDFINATLNPIMCH